MKIFSEFVEIIKKLRAPGGCPWDRKQTMSSITPHIIEEAYELVDAIKQNDKEKIKDELGDVLLHVVMLANMAEEKQQFSISDVIASEKEKMIIRHPHVFADTKVKSINEVWQNWEKIKHKKENEKNANASILDNIPPSLPALMAATKIQKKVARVGFDWNDVSGPIKKVYEEIDEIKNIDFSDLSKKDNLKMELGDLLFSIVNICRKMEIDAEEALYLSNNKFINRFKKVEKKAKKLNKNIYDMSLKELDKIWEEIKKD
jgi:tetrapyrrole methylase family protein/MazG family protein